MRILSLTVICSFVCVHAATADQPAGISRIAFGSCAKQDQSQEIWRAIVDSRPHLFLFLGDNIYADTRDMEVMRTKYAQLAAQPGFKELRATCPVLATWDDHDYGENDAGKEYPKKVESQAIFNDFFDVPADSQRRSRPGIYDVAMFGPPGKRVQIILLDTRYFRDPLNIVGRRVRGGVRSGPFAPTKGDGATILGREQWKWLAEKLREPADVRIVASSVQVVSTEHGWETWGNFPKERQKLFDLIGQTKANGVIFLSGDRHLGEISCDKSDGPYPLYDVTSSGITQGGGGNPKEPNRHRLKPIMSELNFGSVRIDWQPDPKLTLGIHDVRGKAVLEESIRLSSLNCQTQPASQALPGK